MSLKASRMDRSRYGLVGAILAFLLTLLIVWLTDWSYILVFVSLYIFGVSLPVLVKSWRSIKKEVEALNKEVKEGIEAQIRISDFSSLFGPATAGPFFIGLFIN